MQEQQPATTEVETWLHLSNPSSFARLLMMTPIEDGDLPERRPDWRHEAFSEDIGGHQPPL